MFWIDGITHSTAGFSLNTIDLTGARLNQPLAVLAEKLPGETKRSRITTDCATWTRTSAEPFRKLLGIKLDSIGDNHAVFEVSHDSKRYLIPAVVLIAALMRPIQHIQDFLFRPQGLDLMCLPLLDGNKPTVGFYEPEHHIFGTTRRLPDGLLAGYSWMHCFPSARKMWDSVYATAREGRLDLSLPAATLTMALHSVSETGYQLVTAMTVMSVNAHEPPYEFAPNHTRLIHLHESANMDWASAHRPTSSLQSLNGQWGTSDEEWAALSLSLLQSKGTKHDRRKIIDLILTKIGTGQQWRKLAFGDLNFNIVQFTYQQLKKSGHWAVIERLLNESRQLSTQNS